MVAVRKDFILRVVNSFQWVNYSAYGPDAAFNAGTTFDIIFATDGNDSTGDGTVGNPYLTAQKAIDEAIIAGAGTKVAGRAGVYREKPSYAGLEGAEGSPITIEGYNGEIVIFSGAEPATGWVQCDASDADELGPVLGVSDSPVWKYTLADTAYDADHPMAVFPYENGTVLHMAQDRADLTELQKRMLQTKFHVADSFGLDGSNRILTITDASVINSSRYTDAQLENAYVYVYGNPNFSYPVQITSSDVATNTITVDGLVTVQGNTASPASDNLRYSIFNALPYMTAGTYGAISAGGTTTVYVYPTNEANLTENMEVTTRDRGIDVNGCNWVETRGIKVQRVGGDGDGNGVGIHGNNVEGDAKQGLVFEHFTVQQVEQVDSRYGSGIKLMDVYEAKVSRFLLEDIQGSGCAIFGTSGIKSTRPLVNRGIYRRIATTPQNLWNCNYPAWAHCYVEQAGWAAHANFCAIYLDGRYALVWGIRGYECMGYLTWQRQAGVMIAFVELPVFWDGLVNDQRTIHDQQNSTPPPIVGEPAYLFNLSVPPEPGNTGVGVAVQLASTLTDLVYEVANCVAHGITHENSFALDGAEPATVHYNIVTKLGEDNETQTTASFDETTIIELDADVVYADVAGGDYSPVDADSPLVWHGGKNMSAAIAEYTATHTQFTDWNRDVNFRSFSWTQPPIGAVTGGLRANAVPSTAATGDWTLTNGGDGTSLNVGIVNRARGNGWALTDIAYRIDGGDWDMSGGLTAFSITGLTEDVEVDVEIAWVNSVGTALPSDIKTATPTQPVVEVATLDASTWIDLTSVLPTALVDEYVLALRVTNLATNGSGYTPILTSGVGETGRTYLRIWGSNGDQAYTRIMNNSGGSALSGGDANDWAVSATKSIFIRATSGDLEVVIDGVSEVTSASSYTTVYVPQYINSTDAAGANAVAMQLEGFAVSIASGVADGTTGLSYDDFFDGSNEPIDAAFSGTTVGGFAMARTFNTVASYNDFAGTSGTVT